MLNYGNYHGKCMIINTNSPRYNRQLYDYGVFIRPPKYKYLCLVRRILFLACLPEIGGRRLAIKNNLRLCRSDATQNILQRKRIGFVLRNRFYIFGLIRSVFSTPAPARESMFSRACPEGYLPDLCD